MFFYVPKYYMNELCKFYLLNRFQPSLVAHDVANCPDINLCELDGEFQRVIKGQLLCYSSRQRFILTFICILYHPDTDSYVFKVHHLNINVEANKTTIVNVFWHLIGTSIVKLDSKETRLLSRSPETKGILDK